jgi:hypothetical protein
MFVCARRAISIPMVSSILTSYFPVEPSKNLSRSRGAGTAPGTETACEKRAHGLENLRRSDLRRQRRSPRIAFRHDAELARAVGPQGDD